MASSIETGSLNIGKVLAQTGIKADEVREITISPFGDRWSVLFHFRDEAVAERFMERVQNCVPHDDSKVSCILA